MLIPRIAAVLNWRNQVNKSNAYSIHLRITIGEESRYYKIQTPLKVAPEQWSGQENAWVKPSHPFYFEINNKIIEKKGVIHDLIKRFYNLGKNLHFDTILKSLEQKGDHRSFLDFFDAYIKNPPDTLHINTLKKYSTCLTHLKEFKNRIYFSDIDNLLIQDFVKFMSSIKKLGTASSKKYLDALKKVIKQARKEGFLDPSQMDFLYEDVKISVKRVTERIYLTPEEIKAWKELQLDGKTKHLKKVQDLFLFQVYTGYYYKDLSNIKKSQLHKDPEYGLFLTANRDKNDNQTIVPLYKFPYAQEIINRYCSLAELPDLFDKKYLIEEPVYNRQLKEVAKLCKLKKNVTNKVARHTNAQLWVRYGAERPIISKMLGHTKEETTNHYFSVNFTEIAEGTKRINFADMGI